MKENHFPDSLIHWTSRKQRIKSTQYEECSSCSQNHLRITFLTKVKCVCIKCICIHSEAPKINLKISENIMATSQLSAPNSAMYYFYFVITSRNYYTAKLIPLLLTMVTIYSSSTCYINIIGSLALTCLEYFYL